MPSHVNVSSRKFRARPHRAWLAWPPRRRCFRPVFEFLQGGRAVRSATGMSRENRKVRTCCVGQLVRPSVFRQPARKHGGARRSCRAKNDSDKCVRVVSGRSARSSRRGRASSVPSWDGRAARAERLRTNEAPTHRLGRPRRRRVAAQGVDQRVIFAELVGDLENMTNLNLARHGERRRSCRR